MKLFAIKAQFFLSYGVLGSLAPLLALILRDSKDFDARQIGITLAASSIGMLFSPAIMTFLADRNFDTRKILRAIFLFTAIALVAVYFLKDPIPITIAWAAYSIIFIPTLPLLDGYYFSSVREQGKPAGDQPDSYQFIRAWGSAGFMVPAIALFFILDSKTSAIQALWCAITWCALAFAGTYYLHPCEIKQPVTKQTPTRLAMRAMFSRTTLPMCAGLFLVYVGANCYYPYISVFFSDEIGIDLKWIPMISALGVVIEIGYLLGLAPIRRLIKLKGIMVLGLGTMGARLALLTVFPTTTVSLLIQLFHGLEILAMFVVPVIYLDRVAGDSFRNSIQGAFTIVITVPARLIGFLLAGEIAHAYSSREVILTSALLAFISMLLILTCFKPSSSNIEVKNEPDGDLYNHGSD
ncbi:MAG: MFS transporter [Verrucomicrobiales bacterium]|nr:MFS transporter [Verrucomicrobiales bacterium]